MIPIWLVLSRGPLFRLAVAILVLGLVRLAFLSSFSLVMALRRSTDRRVPYRSILRDTAGWLFPFARLHRARPVYSIASFGLHLGILGAGLFLGNHIDIFRASFGLGWLAIVRPVLDVLTFVAILAAGYLLLHRVFVQSSRELSRLMDYLLLVIILCLFLSGFLAGRSWNPIPYDSLMLFHAILGMLLLVMIPFTKIAHCVLYPLIRLSSEIAWHFVPQGGSQVVKTLYGPEGRRI